MQIYKIHLKEEERKNVESKLAAIALIYKKLTKKILSFEFVKTQLEERRKKKKKEPKKQGSGPAQAAPEEVPKEEKA